MENNNSKKGMSFGSVLTLIFIVLKLCKVITWSWVWVLSPLWISVTIILILLVIYGILTIKEKKAIDKQLQACYNKKKRGK